VFAVLAGYLSGSLGDELMSDFDRNIIISARLRGQSVKRWCKRILRNPKNRASLEEVLDETELQPRPEAWKHAVSRFILSLGDQQLVTGLAILISGIANQKTLTLWEFQMVLSLAWFSATSHLATLDALGTYLKAQRVVRHIRVFGMVLVLLLLVYTFGVNLAGALYPVDGITFPVQCIFDQPMAPTSTSSISAAQLVNWLVPLLVVVYGYYSRISELYWGHWLPSSFSKSLRIRASSLWRKSLEHGTALQLLPQDLLEVRLAAARMSALARIARAPKWSTWTRLYAQMYLLSESHFVSFGGIIFSLSYSIVQVSYHRSVGNPLLGVEDTISMGFGQIMAIGLLILPFLAAFEGFYGTVFFSSRLCRSI
jgi:hypothetical protein